VLRSGASARGSGGVTRYRSRPSSPAPVGEFHCRHRSVVIGVEGVEYPFKFSKHCYLLLRQFSVGILVNGRKVDPWCVGSGGRWLVRDYLRLGGADGCGEKNQQNRVRMNFHGAIPHVDEQCTDSGRGIGL